MKKKFTINESENVMTENTAAEAMEQNLKDAGCDVKTRQKFLLWQMKEKQQNSFCCSQSSGSGC